MAKFPYPWVVLCPFLILVPSFLITHFCNISVKFILFGGQTNITFHFNVSCEGRNNIAVTYMCWITASSASWGNKWTHIMFRTVSAGTTTQLLLITSLFPKWTYSHATLHTQTYACIYVNIDFTTAIQWPPQISPLDGCIVLLKPTYVAMIKPTKRHEGSVSRKGLRKLECWLTSCQISCFLSCQTWQDYQENSEEKMIVDDRIWGCTPCLSDAWTLN